METSQFQCSTERTDLPDKDDHNIHEFNFMGYKIFVGRNALSNETLVSEHKKLHKKCIWLHASGTKGAHVVLCIHNHDKVMDDIILRRAAGLAARFSHDRNCNVVYAELQDVFKPIEGVIGVWKTWKKFNIIEL